MCENNFLFALQCLHVERSSLDTASHQQYTTDSRQSVVMLTGSLWFEICYQLNKIHMNVRFLAKKYKVLGEVFGET